MNLKNQEKLNSGYHRKNLDTLPFYIGGFDFLNMVEAKLTKEDVKTIYKLLEKSHTAKDLARRYGVDRTTIWRNDMYDNTLCVFNNEIHSSTNCHELGKMAEKEERIYHIPKEKMMEKHETTVF